MSALVASALFDELAAIGAAAADGESFDATAIDAIAEAGLLHVSVPKEVGGSELPVLDAIDVWSEIARADASIGWVSFAMDTALAYFGAYLPEDGIAELFADGPPRMAGQFAPNGTAVADGDDWIVDGAYQFGSGITIAQVAGCGFLATPPGGGDPAYLFGCLPVEEVELRGNWHVLGLRATQSVDYRIVGGRVPAHRTFDFFAPTVHRGGALTRFGVLPLTAVGHAAWALGATRRVLDELLVAAGRVLELLVPTAQAQAQANLDISSPEIRAVTQSMQARFAELEKYFASGVVGLTANGLVEIRDASAAPLAERAIVKRLVAEDNKDRDTLYAEIAKANGHPEWEPDIRKTFARRWIERGAQPGWYYQDASGAWKQR